MADNVGGSIFYSKDMQRHAEDAPPLRWHREISDVII